MALTRGTTPLFQTDSYRESFDATIVTLDPESRSITLDQTVFYPTGGGQPHDTGMLSWASGSAPVVELRKSGSEIIHVLGGSESPMPAPGGSIRGEIDWERRYALMRMHSALHVLCGVVYRDYQSLVTGGNMAPDHARMDFEMDSAEFSPERVAEIEAAANREIAAEREIRIQILPRDEAFAIPDLIRTRINLLPEGITEIRTVEIVGLDLQADGGTHVRNTQEIGHLKVIGTRSKGKINKRIEIALLAPPTSA